MAEIFEPSMSTSAFERLPSLGSITVKPVSTKRWVNSVWAAGSNVGCPTCRSGIWTQTSGNFLSRNCLLRAAATSWRGGAAGTSSAARSLILLATWSLSFSASEDRSPLAGPFTLAATTRLVSVLMGVGIVIAAWDAARALWGERTAVAAALAVMSLYPMFYYSRVGNPDVPSLFYATIALAALARMIRDGFTARRALFWSAMAWSEAAALPMSVFVGTLLASAPQDDLRAYWTAWALGVGWSGLILLRLAFWLRPRHLASGLAGLIALTAMVARRF